jgi:hypothetical protein
VSFSKRAFEELNEKGKSMNEIDKEQVDIVDAKNLANRLVAHAELEPAANAELLIKRLKSMVVTFATNLFLRDKDAYEQYFKLEGEKSLRKYGGDFSE